jgi:hypothetical protein
MFDWNTIIVAGFSLLGTCIGSWSGLKLMSYRIEQLEKKTDKHNHVIERVYELESYRSVAEEQIKVMNHRISDLEEAEKNE